MILFVCDSRCSDTNSHKGISIRETINSLEMQGLHPEITKYMIGGAKTKNMILFILCFKIIR